MATERRSRWWMLLLFLAGATACYAVLRLVTPAPDPEPPAPVLPDGTVEVEVVPNQVLLDRIGVQDHIIESLGLQLDQTTNELKTVRGELVEAKTYISVDTGPVQPPDPEVVALHIREACFEPDSIRPMGRIRTDLVQFEGLNANDRLAYGWAGHVRSDISLDGGATWDVLAESPLTLENTQAATTEPPVPPSKPRRWSVDLHYALIQDEIAFDAYEYASASRFRVAVGRRWFDRKRVSLTTGVWGESGAAGVFVGVDF